MRRTLAKPHCLLRLCADHFAYFRRIATEYPNATRSSTVRPRPRKHSGKRETKLSPLSSVFKFLRQFDNRFVARAVRIDGPASGLGIEALCVFFPNPRCRLHQAFFERISRKKGIEERAGQIIFVKTTLSLSFSFMKMLSLPTAMPPDAYWNFWECRLRMISKSHRQQYKSKLSNCQRSGRRPTSSSKKIRSQWRRSYSR